MLPHMLHGTVRMNQGPATTADLGKGRALNIGALIFERISSPGASAYLACCILRISRDNAENTCSACISVSHIVLH